MKTGKRILAFLMTMLMVLSCWVWFEPVETSSAANITGDSNYLFAYFTGTSIEGQTIHLAISQDGLNYTALNTNEPVIVPSKGTGCVRDPYLWYNENDGYYYILATDLDFTDTGSDYSDNSESFIVWRSKDLVNWYDETMIDVKAILGRLGINNNNMQAVWAPQVLWDGSSYVVYFSLQCDATSNGSWNPLTIVYLKTSDLLDQSKYNEYGVIHNPGRHVIDADIIKNPNNNKYYMFYKDESASGGVQSIYYMISDNSPIGPYYAPNGENSGRGPQLFSDIGQNLEGCNSFFDDNGNLLTFVDEYGYWNSLTNQNEAHFHVSRSSDFSTFTTLPDSSHNINTLSPRHGSVVKITDEEYNRLVSYQSEITSSSFPETETLSDHLVGRYFTTSDYTYNAANKKNDLVLTDGTISATTDADGDYYAYFNAAGAEINLAQLISGDLNIKDGFTITFSASAPTNLGTNARFFDISNNWSQRTKPDECYLHMSPVAESNGLYVGAYNGPVTTSSWTWASQGKNYNDNIMHEYIISFADGNMILYIDGELALKRDRFNMNAEYGDNFLADNWYKAIGNSTMRIGKSEWSDPLFTGAMQNLCIYDCALSYYDVQKMQKIFDDEAGKTTIAKIAVPETVYMTPKNGASTTGQYYVNNRIHDGSNEVHLEVNPAQTKGVIEFYIPGAKEFEITVTTKTSGVGDIILAEAGATSGSKENVKYNANANGYYSYNSIGFYINGTGISAGSKALAEWKFTVTMNDGSQTTHYAYTTLYAPYLNPVGSAILLEGRYYSNNKLYASSMAWVSGVHGFTNDPAANYFARTDKMVPLINGGAIGTGDNEDNPDTNWISSSAGNNTLPTASFRYNKVTGSSGKLGAIGVYRSPVANLTIDTSRYSNFNQIPNLTVGFNYTDKENAGEVYWYVSDYTDGNMTYMKDYSRIASRDDVNTDAGYYYNIQGDLITNTGVNQAQVSTGAEHNAKWDRAVKPGSSNTYIFKSGAYAYRSYLTGKGAAYSVNYILVNGTNVDKTELRNLVLRATYFNEADYTPASWSAYQTALQNAALVLGDPANADVSAAVKTLNEKMAALQTTVTLNANGGTINGSATATVNVTVGTETTIIYNVAGYTSPVRDGYIFMGWATSADAEAGSKTTLTADLMPTFYAVWQIAEINVTFDNLIDFNAWDKVAGNGVVSDVTDTGLTVTSNAGVSEACTSSPYFDVTPGKSYKIDVDIVGTAWDVYIFFCDANGTWVDFADSTSRYSSNGSGNSSRVFKAPNKSNVVKAQIRLDANGSENTVKFNNIRVYEDVGISVSPVNKVVKYGSAYGELPVPERDGYEFIGWFDGNNYVTETTVMNSKTTVNLTSKWAISSVVTDFDSAVAINPIDGNESMFAIEVTSSQNGDFGTFTTSDNKIIYTPNKVFNGIDIATYTISFRNITKSFDLLVAPASSVLYNEDKLTVSNTSGNAWVTDGTASTVKQTQSGKNDVYGYDVNYKNDTGYSYGTAYKVSVDSMNTRSQTLKFNYQGNAVDLYASCGENTGIYIVTIRDINYNTIEKVYITDTYFSDSSFYGDAGKINQAPIIHHENSGSGSYSVEITSAYLASVVSQRRTFSMRDRGEMNFYTADIAEEAKEAILMFAEMEDLLGEDIEVTFCDENSVFNGGSGVPVKSDFGAFALTAQADNGEEYTSLDNYFDGFRVYNAAAYDGMYLESEQGAAYYNVVENLLSEDDIITSENDLTGIAYLEKVADEDYNLGTYEQNGPKHELYLKPGASITLTVKSTNPDAKAMVSLRTVNGNQTSVEIANGAVNGTEIVKDTYTITNTTDMYYRINNVEVDENAESFIITIENTGSSYLVIGTLRLCNGLSLAPMMMSAMPRVRMMMAAPATETEPNAPVEEEILPSEPEVDVPETDIPDTDVSDTENSDADSSKSFFNNIKDFINKIIEFFTKIIDKLKAFIA